MRYFARLATVLFVLAVPVFLVTANVRFVAGETWFYERGFRAHDADVVTGIPLDELDRAAADLVRYFEDDRASLRIPVTVDGAEVSLYNDEETEHMRDVKSLMGAVFRLNEASLAIILGYIGCVVLWSGERSVHQLARSTLIGVGVGLAVVVAIGGFALTGFDRAWTTFHEIAFRNDLWLLDPDTDRLIQMFPEEFWAEMTFIVAALTVTEVVVLVLASAFYMLRTRETDIDGAERLQRVRERRAAG